MSKIIKDKHFLASSLIIAALFVAVLITNVNSEQASSQEKSRIERVSIASDGEEGINGSGIGGPRISENGRYVAFSSQAFNLVPDNTGAERDVYLHDRQARTTQLISAAPDGTEADDRSGIGAISNSGRYVFFNSKATNLVPEDVNPGFDAYVYDLETNTMELVSRASDGTQANGDSIPYSVSASGRYIALQTSASNLGDRNAGPWNIFVRDRETRTTKLAAVTSDGVPADGSSQFPSISADGRYVTFQSPARNLIPGVVGSKTHIFVHDREAGITEHVKRGFR